MRYRKVILCGWRRGCRCRCGCYRCRKPVTQFGESLYKPWSFMVVFKGLSYFLHRRVDGVLEFNELPVRPQSFLNFGARYQLSSPARKKTEKPGRLPLQADGPAILEQFSRRQVEFERIEPDPSILLKFRHCSDGSPTIHPRCIAGQRMSLHDWLHAEQRRA